MSDQIKIIVFMLASTCFNVVITMGFSALFLFIFLKFIASSLDPVMIDYGIMGIIFTSVIIDFIIYKLLMLYLTKKFDLAFLRRGLFKKMTEQEKQEKANQETQKSSNNTNQDKTQDKQPWAKIGFPFNLKPKEEINQDIDQASKAQSKFQEKSQESKFESKEVSKESSRFRDANSTYASNSDDAKSNHDNHHDNHNSNSEDETSDTNK